MRWTNSCTETGIFVVVWSFMSVWRPVSDDVRPHAVQSIH
jgi:hypothetical protein